MPSTHSAYGLNIQASRPLPGLPVSPLKGPVDIRIDLEKTWYDTEPEEDEIQICVLPGSRADAHPILRIWKRAADGRFRFRYGDGTEFTIDASGGHICASWPEPLTLEDASIYLLGPVVGFTLRLHGMVCLHASAIAVAGSAIALMAPPGHGKSTLAARFAMLEHPVLTDDISAVTEHRDRFLLKPAFPRLHLWPSAVESLFGTAEALPRLCPHHPTWDKRYLSLDVEKYRFQHEQTPLAAIYTGEYSEDQDGYEIESLTGHRAFTTLIANSYSWYALDKEMRAREFDVLSRVVDRIPLRCIKASRRDDLSSAHLCRVILDDFGAL